MEEIWKDIPGYEGLYQVSNLGRIKSLSRKKPTKYGGYIGEIIRKTKRISGYANLCIYKDGKDRYYMVHRLVALAFLENPEFKTDVNHKNGIRDDNRLENLEWCTRSENMKHSFAELGNVVHFKGKPSSYFKNIRKVGLINDAGNVEKEWISIADASRELSIEPSNINACCNLKRKKAGGFRWAYI